MTADKVVAYITDQDKIVPGYNINFGRMPDDKRDELCYNGGKSGEVRRGSECRAMAIPQE